MNHEAVRHPPGGRKPGLIGRVLRGILMGVTLLFVILALLVSVSLLIFTAWNHDLGRGIFALVFAVLSAQIALNWLLWKEDAE